MHAEPSKNPKEESAFTRTELAVVIATLAVLATVRLSALTPAGEKVHRLGCLNNLKQLAMGSMMYAQENNGHYSGRTWQPSEIGSIPPGSDRSASDDDLNWLYPRYVKSLNTFICPSTQNRIRTNLYTIPDGSGRVVLIDLGNNGRVSDSYGTSYEVLGNFPVAPGTTKKREDTVNAFTISHYVPALGIKPGPSRVFLIRDGDDVRVGSAGDVNDWPDDPADNHGAAGENFSFCDGHAQWVSQSKFLEVWNISQDSNRTPP